MADKTASFGIKIPVDTNAAGAADSVDALKAAIEASQAAVKNYGSSLKNLRGSSDEVKEAKKNLRAAVNAERDAISRNVLALGKHGKTLEDVSKGSKELKSATAGVSNALTTAGGPANALRDKMATLRDVFKDGSGALNLFVLGSAAVVGAIVAIAAAAGAGAVKLASFILEMGNLTRTQGLFREAATGSAANASALGHQIDALTSKVPQSRAELEALGNDTFRAFENTRISGQGVVDAFNAVAQSSAAMGDSAGRAIQGILERGKQFGRFGMGINELQGTGINFHDVAGQLSKDLKISLGDAQNELVMGRVKLDTGAKVLREVVEKRFGAINLRRMLDLNVIGQKFRDTLQQMTKDVNLEPVLEGFQRLAGLFDVNTENGKSLKLLVTDFGNGLARLFKEALPYAELFFMQLTNEGLKFEIALLRLRNYLRETFGADAFEGIDGAKLAIEGAKVTFGLFAAALIFTGVALAALAAPFVALGAIIYGFQAAGKSVYDWFTTRDWSLIGSNIVEGIKHGLLDGTAALLAGVGQMADSVKNAFKNALGIHSPSLVFKQFGEQTTEGYAQGVNAGAPAAQSSVASMIAPPKAAGGAGGLGSGGPINLTLNLSFPNAKNGAEVAQTLTGGAFKAQFTALIEELLRSTGGGSQTPQGGIT